MSFLRSLSSTSVLISSFFAFSFLSSAEVMAQCNPTGCFAQPVFLTPSAAQDISIEFRKSSSHTVFIQENPQPVSFKPLTGFLPSTFSPSSVRTWSNGEGQWKNLSNGSACLVSSSSKSLNSSPQCSETF